MSSSPESTVADPLNDQESRAILARGQEQIVQHIKTMQEQLQEAWGPRKTIQIPKGIFDDDLAELVNQGMSVESVTQIQQLRLLRSIDAKLTPAPEPEQEPNGQADG